MSELSDGKIQSRREIYLDYLNPDIEDKPKLTKKQQEYFELMQFAYQMRTKFFSPDQVRRQLMEHGQKRNYSSACQIYVDMEFVYGKTAEINKDALKRVLMENYYTLIQNLYKSNVEEPEKSKMIGSFLDKISKLYGLDNADSLTADMVMPARSINILNSGTVQIAQTGNGGN